MRLLVFNRPLLSSLFEEAIIRLSGKVNYLLSAAEKGDV